MRRHRHECLCFFKLIEYYKYAIIVLITSMKGMTNMKVSSMKKMKQLIQLAEENPNLRVVPIVDSNLFGNEDFHDDFNSCWLGSWGESSLDEILVTDNQYFLKSDIDGNEDFEGYLLKRIDTSTSHMEDQTFASFIKVESEKLPWEKVIVVTINSNDGEGLCP